MNETAVSNTINAAGLMTWESAITSLIHTTFLVVAGAIVVTLILYYIYRQRLVFQLWIRIFPSTVLMMLNTNFLDSIGMIPGVNSGLTEAIDFPIAIAIVVAVFVFTGRYFEKSIENTVARLREASDEVSSVSTHISSASQDLAQSSSEQSSSISEASSTLEEITSISRLNAESTTQAYEISKRANEEASAGLASIKMMEDGISQIKKASDETAKIIKSIDEIAFQTNLLALNAAVEAARAGEAGKGFAVVAEEVRNLSKRAAEAVKNTTALIESVQKNVEYGILASKEVNETFNKIGGSVSKAAQLISEVSTSSSEQAAGLDQINTAVAEMDRTTQKNSANAEESASASEELSSQVIELNGMIEALSGFIGLDNKKVKGEQA